MRAFKIIVPIFLIMTAGYAQAAIIDFRAMADNQYGALYGDFSLNLGETAHKPLDITVGGLGLKASGYWNDTTDVPDVGDLEVWAYLDANKAGLGVCHLANGACAGKSDDNLTDYETLHITFDEGVTLTNLSLIRGDHNTFTSSFQLSLDGTTYNTYNYQTQAALFTGIFSKDFWFKTITPQDDRDAIYISSMTVVTSLPEAGSLAMFSMGLLAMVLVRRRSTGVQSGQVFSFGE
jgi:hypothetical protein